MGKIRVLCLSSLVALLAITPAAAGAAQPKLTSLQWVTLLSSPAIVEVEGRSSRSGSAVRVQLQRKDGKRWRTVQAKTPSSSGRFRLSWRLPNTEPATFRVRLRSGGKTTDVSSRYTVG